MSWLAPSPTSAEAAVAARSAATGTSPVSSRPAADGIAEGEFVDGAPGDFLGETDVGGDAAEVDSADDADDLGGYGGPAAGVGGCGHRECTCDEA